MLLQVQDLRVLYPLRRGWFGGDCLAVKALDGVSCSLGAGETLGLVGESGCGKTTLGRAIVGLVRPCAGSIWWRGTNLVESGRAKWRECRRRVQMVFQDPYSALDPRMTIGESVGEALDIHRLTSTRAARRARVAELLEAVGLDPAWSNRYPHEFSGGQRQRIGIARALAVEPELVICDEPVSALDVSVQAQVVNLLRDLQQARGLAYLFISHDLALVEQISHRIAVMYLGRIVETAGCATLIANPKHPYTQALIAAAPTVGSESHGCRIVLPGEMPSPLHPPGGCPFHPRCPVAEPRCTTEPPVWREFAPGHSVACHLAQ